MKRKFIFVFLLVILLCSDVQASKNSTRKVQSHYRRKAKQENGRCECGRANEPAPQQGGNMDMIVAGSVVKPVYKYPWMIGIFSQGQQYCGGALITPNHVLTAAHCVVRLKTEGKEIEGEECIRFLDNSEQCTMPLDSFELRYNGDQPGLKNAVGIERVMLSLAYSVEPIADDIALVKTAEALPCNKFTAPVCLPTVCGLTRPKKGVIIAGWGQTSDFDTEGPTPEKAVLKEAKLILESQEVCQQLSKMSPYSICCKASDGQACKGDSGGPLFKKHKGRYYLIGVTSYGMGTECKVNKPTFYTKVKSYLPWIEQNIGNI